MKVKTKKTKEWTPLWDPGEADIVLLVQLTGNWVDVPEVPNRTEIWSSF